MGFGLDIEWRKDGCKQAVARAAGKSIRLRDYDGFADQLNANPHKVVWERVGCGMVRVGYAFAKQLARREKLQAAQAAIEADEVAEALVKWYDLASKLDPEGVVRFWNGAENRALHKAQHDLCPEQTPHSTGGRAPKDYLSNLCYRDLTEERNGEDILNALLRLGRPLVVVFSDGARANAVGWRLAIGPVTESKLNDFWSTYSQNHH